MKSVIKSVLIVLGILIVILFVCYNVFKIQPFSREDKVETAVETTKATETKETIETEANIETEEGETTETDYIPGIDDIEILDGDYTYVDNDVLMEIIEGEWESEDHEYQLTISSDYTMRLTFQSQVLLETSIKYVFLQPGPYRDVDITLGSKELAETQANSYRWVDSFYTDLDNSMLIMGLAENQDDYDIEVIPFVRGEE